MHIHTLFNPQLNRSANYITCFDRLAVWSIMRPQKAFITSRNKISYKKMCFLSFLPTSPMLVSVGDNQNLALANLVI